METQSADKKVIDMENGQTNNDTTGEEYGEIGCTQCCKAFCTPLGIWVTFGFVYWVTTALMGYFEQENGELFVWTVASAIIAVMLQFCVLAVVIGGWTAHHPLVSENSLSELCCFSCNYCTKLPCSLLAVFPYTCWIVIDICVHFAVNVQNTHFTFYSALLLSGHMVSLFFITFIYYYFGKKRSERMFRALNFSFEWFDLASQLAVVLVYKANSNASNTQYYVNILWGFIFIQIVFWVLPIALGAGVNKSRICKHVWFIDVVTDIPILIIILASGAYKVQFWILIDILVKVILLARGCILNFCVFWLLPKLQKGRVQKV